MKKVVLLLTIALAIPAFAGPLAPGGVLYNPQLAGTGEIGSAGPYYSNALPAWVTGANLVDSLTSDISGIPGFATFRGTVESWCYRLANGNTGLVYRINLSANSAPRLVRASISSSGFESVDVLDAGADGSGSSTPGAGNTTWGDGDPFFIERDALGLSPQWVYRLGTDGTVLNPGNQSSLVFFETSAPGCAIGTISLLDGGAAGAAQILTVGIPSPAAASLGMLGMSALFAVRRRVEGCR